MHAIYIATVHTKQKMETTTVTLKDVSSSPWPKESFPCSVSWTSSVFSQWVFRFLYYPKRENSICFFLIPQSVNLSLYLFRPQRREWDVRRGEMPRGVSSRLLCLLYLGLEPNLSQIKWVLKFLSNSDSKFLCFFFSSSFLILFFSYHSSSYSFSSSSSSSSFFFFFSPLQFPIVASKWKFLNIKKWGCSQDFQLKSQISFLSCVI